ncbi:hypothetical protein Dimus_013753 [Dionaea muscipula]
MEDNGLSKVMELIKRQRWEKLFKRREFVHVDAVKEFYARMTLVNLKKKDVVTSSVRGVSIEFDHLKLASILGIPGNNGICEYIKDVWEESKYIKPLEITRKFANDNTILTARRVISSEMKPFQKFIHFLVMKNVVPRFGNRDTTSYMDLTHMDHLTTRRLVNLPRVMMRHMSYVISMKDHELPYRDWLTMVFEDFGVPLVDKKGEEPKRIEEGMMRLMLQQKRLKRKKRHRIKILIGKLSLMRLQFRGIFGSDDLFFDAQVDVEEPAAEAPVVPPFPASPRDSTNQQREQTTAGVDLSGLSCHILESVMIKLQAEFQRARVNRI